MHTMQPEEWDRLHVILSNYLAPFGLELDIFSSQIRRFFEEGQDHYDRLVYRNTIAECLGINISNTDNLDALWRKIGKERGISRKVVGQWITGEIDPPATELKRYLRQLGCPNIKHNMYIFLDEIEPIKMGIARTLTYIYVYPPANGARLPDTTTPSEWRKCWEDLKRHVHYRTPANNPRNDLNQHAIDQIKSRLDGRFWVEPDKIGEVKCHIEKKVKNNELYWPFLLFKYATLVNISATHRVTTNEHNWIWKTTHPHYQDIWRL